VSRSLNDKTDAPDKSPGKPSQPWRYWVLLILLGLGLAMSAMPSPLYAIYSDRWNFAPVVTTLIFAAYGVGALASVLVSGALSDRYGRRPVMLAALTFIFLGLVAFIVAPNAVFLIIARLLHGVGIGAIVVAAGAALLDVRPEWAARTGALNAIAFNLGIAVGTLCSAILAQNNLAPLTSPYLLFGALSIAVGVAVLAMREPHAAPSTARTDARFRIPRPRVPSAMLARFVFAAGGAGTAWAVLGVFLSLEPGIATEATGAHGPLFGGVMITVFALGAAAAQLTTSNLPSRQVAVTGDIASAVLLITGLPAFASGSSALILINTALLGAAYGLAFGASLRHLTSDLPSGQRGSVISAFYLVTYSAMAVPTILAGIAATVWSSTTIFTPFCITAAVVALATALLGIRRS
jgi:hypothetical protein